MDEDRNNDATERFKTILSADKDDEMAPPQPLPQPESQSLLEKLPQLKPATQAPPKIEPEAAASKPETTASSVSLNKLPQMPQSKQPEQPEVEQPIAPTEDVSPTATPYMPRREKYLRALWTLASVISMVVNVVVIIILVIAFWAYRDIKLPESTDIAIANDLLGGLYSNFEKLDRASIKTVIPVDADIPLNITVPVQTTTQITLAETVSIPNAQVVINTGGLNINSTARVTLPAGTPLTVNLNFELPVQDTIPVHLEVPVDIPMAETELHEPFVGLQEVVQPLYCFVDPNAANLDGQVICR